MTELKTLKDMEDILLEIEDAYILKQEAIKWIEFLMEQIETGEGNLLYFRAQMSWIKHFFNIEESDLK